MHLQIIAQLHLPTCIRGWIYKDCLTYMHLRAVDFRLDFVVFIKLLDLLSMFMFGPLCLLENICANAPFLNFFNGSIIFTNVRKTLIYEFPLYPTTFPLTNLQFRLYLFEWKMIFHEEHLSNENTIIENYFSLVLLHAREGRKKVKESEEKWLMKGEN